MAQPLPRSQDPPGPIFISAKIRNQPMVADRGPYWRALGNAAVETQSEKIATNERRRRISSNFREPPAIIKKGDQLVLQKRRSRASHRTVRSTMCTLPGATARRAPVAIAVPRSPPTMECPILRCHHCGYRRGSPVSALRPVRVMRHVGGPRPARSPTLVIGRSAWAPPRE